MFLEKLKFILINYKYYFMNENIIDCEHLSKL